MKLSMHSKLTVAAMAFLGLASVGAGCGDALEETGTSPPAAQSRQQALSGRELYKGMFFGVGPAVGHFEELWRQPEFQAGQALPEQRQQNERTAERLAAKLEAEDPAFFDRFARELRSRDHLTIDRLVAEAQKRTWAAAGALHKEDGSSEPVRGSAIAAQDPGIIILVEQTVEATTDYWLFPGPPPVSQATGLLRDEWVDLLANKTFDAQ